MKEGIRQPTAKLQPLGGGVGPGKGGLRAQPARRALGDLTNSLKGAAPPATAAKPEAAKSEAVKSVVPVEQSAGKGWRAMAAETEEQEGAAAQQQLRRIAHGARTWTTSHLKIYQDDSSSDGEDGELQGRYIESAIVVQPPGAPGVDGIPLSVLRSQGDAHALLPVLPFDLSCVLLDEGDGWGC